MKTSLTLIFLTFFLVCAAQKHNLTTLERDSIELFGKCNTNEDLRRSTFTKMEILPAFPGGWGKWFDFLQTNFNFLGIQKDIPDSILYYNDSALVRFVVPRAGGLCQFSFLNNPSDALKRAVIELFKLSPDWKPGITGNRNINGNRTLKIEVVIDRMKGTNTVVRNSDHYYLIKE